MPSLDDALFYNRAGLAIFPCCWITETGACSCGKSCGRNAGKHPCWDRTDLQRGRKDATTNEAQVRTWWTRWPDANIGMPMGRINGLLALDADVRDERPGMESLRTFLGDVDPETTLVSRSGSGGWHVLFALAPDEFVPTRIGFMPGLDVMGEASYILVAPSTHQSGDTYRWLSRKPPLPLPDPVRRVLTSEAETAFGQSPVSEEDWVQQVYEGSPSRDKYITRLAGSLLRSRMPPQMVYEVLLRQNQEHCVPPLPRRDVKKCVQSCIRMEKKRRDEHRAAEVTESQATPPTERVFDYTGFNRYMEEYGGQEAPWLIEGWLPQASLGFVLGPPESYKTWTLMDMALAFSTGRPFLGHYPVLETGPVLWVQQEDAHPMIAARFTQILQIGEVERLGPKRWRVPWVPEPEPPIHVHRTRRLSFSDKQSIRELDLAIRETHAKLVLIDPLYALLSLEDYGAKTAQEMMLFKRMRDLYGCSFVIGHHMKKGEKNGRARDMGWGSQFLNAWIEMGIEIIPSALTPGKVLIERHSKGHLRPPLLDVQWRITDTAYDVTLLETAAPQATLVERMKEVIRTQKITSREHLMDSLGIKGVRTIVQAMKEAGVTKLDDCYVLSEDIRLPRLVRGGLEDNPEEPA